MTLKFETSSYDGAPENGSQTAPTGAQRGPEGLPLDVPMKRSRGGQKGNANNLRHGGYSQDMEKAKKRKLRGSARRREIETLAAVLADQGNLDDIPVTLQFVCRRFSRRVGRLHAMDRAEDKLIRKNPKLKDNPSALAKLYELSRPLENDAIADAKIISFERRANEKSITELIAEAAKEEPQVKPRTVDEMIAQVRAARGETDGSDEVKDD